MNSTIREPLWTYKGSIILLVAGGILVTTHSVSLPFSSWAVFTRDWIGLGLGFIYIAGAVMWAGAEYQTRRIKQALKEKEDEQDSNTPIQE